jgi:hypothetical protein
VQANDKLDIRNDAANKLADGPASGALWDIIKMFGYIGLTSFGGGLSAWIYLEAVERRRWLPCRP